VLIQLRKATKKALRDAIVDGWLACAPTHLAAEFVRRPGPTKARRPTKASRSRTNSHD